ncbi:MAG: alpha-glucosidase [Acidobacteriaceae bacterium]|nr:alpha-glucosidase [Acidobacteriaceae bacterium]
MVLLRRMLAVAALASSLSLSAQMLSRPGWAGSGMSSDPWWQHAVIYEIYPRSFQDSNGDGIGDLKGITQRLDYLQSLGVDAIWLTPIYPSPQVDFGYDISDYTAIDPQYGTMEDFDNLVQEASRRNIRVLMDLVLNHTSDKHAWFVESASSKANPKRDWYVWRDGKGAGADGKPAPPNNWQSLFGHSAWQYDEKTGQFYYHCFYPQQPDLNWRNAAVRQAMFDVARFWLNRGVAGFRLDAIDTLLEDPSLADAKESPGKNAFGDPNVDHSPQMGLPEIHGILRELRAVINNAPGQRLLVGEIYTKSAAELASWYGAKNDELHLPMDTGVGFTNKLDAAAFREKLETAQTQLHGNPPLLVFDNHDNPRSWDRYGDGQHNKEIARVLATILLTSRSASLLYYGQELGMATATPERKEDVKDPIGVLGWPKEKGRDGERTPMQWDGGAEAGFSKAAKTWLPIPTSSMTVNVEAEQKDDQSVLKWYEQLIALRRSRRAMREGQQILLNHDADNALVWVRKHQGVTATSPAVIVACNFSDKPVTLHLKSEITKLGLRGQFLRSLMRSDYGMGPMNLDAVKLEPFGVYIGEIHY